MDMLIEQLVGFAVRWCFFLVLFLLLWPFLARCLPGLQEPSYLCRRHRATCSVKPMSKTHSESYGAKKCMIAGRNRVSQGNIDRKLSFKPIVRELGHCCSSAEEHSFCLLRHLQSEITERRVDSVIDGFLELLNQNVPFGEFFRWFSGWFSVENPATVANSRHL